MSLFWKQAAGGNMKKSVQSDWRVTIEDGEDINANIDELRNGVPDRRGITTNLRKSGKFLSENGAKKVEHKRVEYWVEESQNEMGTPPMKSLLDFPPP